MLSKRDRFYKQLSIDMATGFDYGSSEGPYLEDDDDDSEGWSEMDVESESTLTCLFCPKPFKTMAVALEHCKIEHGFDLIFLKKKFSMDCYSYISLVNYVRREGAQPEQISSCSAPLWLDEQYLTPVMQEDPWLMFDFEGLESPLESRAVSPELGNVVSRENGLVTLTEQSFTNLLDTIKRLRAQVAEQDTALSLASEQIQAMRTVTQNIMSCDGTQQVDKSVAKLRISEDHDYFSSYSHFGIHHTMLADKPRTVSYRDAILKNASCVQGKVILDVGCGTAILSMFCVQAGAAKVIGVDQSDIIYYAMDIIRENNTEEKIELVKGRIEEVKLPVEKVDVIISEWMGYFLLFEGMLDAVILARDKYLRPGGSILPNKCSLLLVGLSDPGSYHENLDFWSDVYGYKMTSLKNEVLKEAYITNVPESCVVTSSSVILDLDLATCSRDSSEFSSVFQLTCEKDCCVTSICGYFETLFELPNPIVLTTSPLRERTHWKQTVFYLHKPIQVFKGATLEGRITCRKKPDDNRALVIDLEVQDQKNTYYLA